MTRKPLFTFTLACALAMGALPANAGVFSWLEDFSGPGPFTGSEFPLFATSCRFKLKNDTQAAGEVKPYWSFGVTPRDRASLEPEWCLYFDHVAVSAEPARGYPRVHVRRIDVGGSYPLANGLFDIGAGVGWFRFKNERTENREDRFSLTPIRLVSRPFLFVSHFQGKQGWLTRLASTFKVYFQETALLGTPLTAEDFGADTTVPGNPASGFQTFRGELVRAYGWTIDLTELLGRK